MRQAWTSSEEKWLTALAHEMTVAELCEKLERSKASIVGKLNNLGVTAKPKNHTWTVREDRIVREMMGDFTYEDIARETGRTSASVRGYILRNYNPKTRRRVWNPTREQIDRLAQLRAERKSVPEISRIMRCGVASVKRIISEHNIRRGIGYVR